MEVSTQRFGSVLVNPQSIMRFPVGLVGFPDLKQFVIIDPQDDTLILWLQSLEDPKFCLPIIEASIVSPGYRAKVSAHELQTTELKEVGQANVFVILTIPADLTEMSANLKAPLIINENKGLAHQVVQQDGELSLKKAVFKELKAVLVTIAQQQKLSGLSDLAPEKVDSRRIELPKSRQPEL